MSSSSSPRRRGVSRPAATWCWQRWIEPARLEEWTAKIEQSCCATWIVTEKPGRRRHRIAVYLSTRAEAVRLQAQFQGQVDRVDAKTWNNPRPLPPLKIGAELEILHETTHSIPADKKGRLYIPHGLAFGSGEHATTFLLLRALLRRQDLAGGPVLDLGTGSGVLALAARLLGAQRIVATDWDAEAIRTARQNEALNFRGPLIRWQRADVKRLRARSRYRLILANLFSGILCEAAAPISSALQPGGELWLSGVLRVQEEEVTAAYRAQRLRLLHVARRGKWIMLQWQKPPD
jgi:ribosomal protein L11 methyltransferase